MVSNIALAPENAGSSRLEVICRLISSSLELEGSSFLAAGRASYFQMNDLGKFVIGLGVLLILSGAVLLIFSRLNVPIGRLPGDIRWQSRSGNTRVYFPLVTSLVLSAVLSLVLWLVNSYRR
jgi:Protein of unknown function (DUF2905)